MAMSQSIRIGEVMIENPKPFVDFNPFSQTLPRVWKKLLKLHYFTVTMIFLFSVIDILYVEEQII